MSVEIWTEKYRPKRLSELVNQKHVVDSLLSWVKDKSIPHMIFTGPAGTGKTTCSIALARELFGDNWRENFLETNASDERGIDVVRNKIKDFARTKPIGVGFRIAFLDESDALTSEAQQALRRTMEKYAGSCRFILSCNYSSRLIEPIRSRCSVFRFKKLSKEDVFCYIERVAGGEGLEIEKDAMEAVYELSGGDLRQTTNLLQACASKKITKDIVFTVSSQARPKDIGEMVGLALQGKFKEARDRLHAMLFDQGLAAEDIIKGIHREAATMEIEDKRRLSIIGMLAETEFRVNQGSSPDIQLESFLAQVAAGEV